MRGASVILAALLGVFAQLGFAQQTAAIEGTVADANGSAAANAAVLLELKDHPGALQAKTNAKGEFAFSTLQAGSYRISSEELAPRSHTAEDIVLDTGERKVIHLVLQPDAADRKSSAASTAEAMQFSDQPNFTVAGVTDWTAAGGHGSDIRLRTSEELAREALVLKAGGNAADFSDGMDRESESELRATVTKNPGSFEANHRLGAFYLREGRYAEAIPLLLASYKMEPKDYGNKYDLALAYQENRDFSQARDHIKQLLAHEDKAELHRLLADVDEELGDPLAAVHEYEKAVSLDPSERNYFAWGSELLLHRAVQPATEVFEKGARAYPTSARMLAGLGAALFTGGKYDEAARRVCDASDLNPEDPAPYIFLGKIEMAAPMPLACVVPKLTRFAQWQPGNALANYYYAMALWKEKPNDLQQVKALLTKAVDIDLNFDEAYLQLGNVCSAERDFKRATGFYQKAIALNPQLSEAHYRLGVAYERTGKPAEAQQEFALHDAMEKQQAAAIDRQRREIKQFLVVLKEPAPALSHN